MKLSLIVARHVTSDVIGVDGELPWHCPQDLKLFKEITSGPNKAIVMGRNTWDSLPIKPLKGRLNVVVTSNPKAIISSSYAVVTADGIEDSIKLCERMGIEELFFIGGKAIYDAVVDIVDEAYVSEMMMDLYTAEKPVVRFEYEFTQGEWEEKWTDVFDDGKELLFTHYHFVRKK